MVKVNEEWEFTSPLPNLHIIKIDAVEGDVAIGIETKTGVASVFLIKHILRDCTRKDNDYYTN